MPQYRITFARSARRELERLPVAVAGRILDKIAKLSNNPRPYGCVKLRGPSQLWRIRVGEYRVIYEIDKGDHIVDVSVVRHRSDACR
jgi:mRNA interferase RelE/StbE